jgi:hypothetical protein
MKDKEVIVGFILLVLAALGFFVGIPLLIEAVSLNETLNLVFWIAVILMVLLLIHKRGHSKGFFKFVSVFVAVTFFFTGVSEGFTSAITYTLLGSGLIAYLLIFHLKD